MTAHCESVPVIRLGGVLASHARGRTLAASFGAKPMEPADAAPRAGACLVFGREFQAAAERAGGWLEWAALPGRLLVVQPPFVRGPCALPAQWEARRAESLAGGENELARLLARERQYEIQGRLLPLERSAGQVVSAGWRRHPAAGLVVITALPLWSLSALDHPAACASWIEGLYAQAGIAARQGAADDDLATRTRELTPDEWALLLHLYGGRCQSEAAALEALACSTVHRLPVERARVALGALCEQGLAHAGAVTERGEARLLGGRYAAFARVLCGQHASHGLEAS